MGRANPQEKSGVREVLGPHREKRLHCWKHIWWRLGRGEENTGKVPLPESSWRESGKLETATGTKLKREKGERRKEKGERRKENGEGLNSIKTVNKGSAKFATPELNTWRCSGGEG